MLLTNYFLVSCSILELLGRVFCYFFQLIIDLFVTEGVEVKWTFTFHVFYIDRSVCLCTMVQVSTRGSLGPLSWDIQRSQYKLDLARKRSCFR